MFNTLNNRSLLCEYAFEKRHSLMQCLLILIVLDKEINIQFQAAETFAKAVLSDILMMNDAEVHINVLGNGLVFL